MINQESKNRFVKSGHLVPMHAKNCNDKSMKRPASRIHGYGYMDIWIFPQQFHWVRFIGFRWKAWRETATQRNSTIARPRAATRVTRLFRLLGS